jgi:hypothetical protein
MYFTLCTSAGSITCSPWPPLKSSSRLKGQSLRHYRSCDVQRFPWVGLGKPELRSRSRRAGLPENRISGYRFQQQLKHECQGVDGGCGYPSITSYSATHILSKVVSPWVIAINGNALVLHRSTSGPFSGHLRYSRAPVDLVCLILFACQAFVSYI